MDINGNNVNQIMENIAKELVADANPPEELNKIRLPPNFNQDNCFLRAVTASGQCFYIDWSIQFGFPITKFMNQEDIARYSIEYYEKYCPKEGISTSAENSTMYVAMKQEHIEALISNNHAGLKGEYVTWNEILELYGKDVLKEQIQVPQLQNGEVSI
jgi:hypothetical protein